MAISFSNKVKNWHFWKRNKWIYRYLKLKKEPNLVKFLSFLVFRLSKNKKKMYPKAKKCKCDEFIVVLRMYLAFIAKPLHAFIKPTQKVFD